MNPVVTRYVVAFVSGLLFAVGLAMSGMVLPARILGFLDVTGAWDPTLLYVMGGAVAVTLALFRLVLRRNRPVLDTTFHLPTRHDVDMRLVGGSALFGIGWGLSGLCPGPALTNVVAGVPEVWLFVAAMLAGMGLYNLQQRWGRVARVTGPDDVNVVGPPTHREGGAGVAET